MSVAPSSFGMLTIGRIAYRREGGDGSAQCERSVIYDCLVLSVVREYENCVATVQQEFSGSLRYRSVVIIRTATLQLKARIDVFCWLSYYGSLVMLLSDCDLR